MSVDAEASPRKGGRILRKLGLAVVLLVGGLLMLMWSVVLPILGIVYLVDRF